MPPSITLGRFLGASHSPEVIAQYGRGRGIGASPLVIGECLCGRPRSRILCHVCGYHGWGRLRYCCPKHPQTIFLIDMSECPGCRAYAFMMSEF